MVVLVVFHFDTSAIKELHVAKIVHLSNSKKISCRKQPHNGIDINLVYLNFPFSFSLTTKNVFQAAYYHKISSIFLEPVGNL